jgi:polysaccharide export outer membrane protein
VARVAGTVTHRAGDMGDATMRGSTIPVRVIALMVVGLGMTACAPRQPARPPTPAPMDARSAAGGLGAEDRARVEALVASRSAHRGAIGYRIGADDLLEIRIPDLVETAPIASRPNDGGVAGSIAPMSGTPSFQQGVRVSATGDITLPYLGQVRADGLTPADLERKIARDLVSRGILRNPQVSVSVIEYRSRVVAVVGAVEHPGVFPVTRPGATVSDLIWTAGGPSKEAGRVVRFMPASGDGDGKADVEAVSLDLQTLLHPPSGSRGASVLPVHPGDVISVEPAGNVTVEGWVGKPGSYPVTRGLSVAGAVAAAGGPVFAADRHHATIQRAGGEREVMTVDLDAIARGEAQDVAMADGDVVRVPASTARVVPWAMWSAIRDMFRIGGDVLVF